MIKLIFLPELYQMIKRRIYVGRNGFKKYEGDSKHICKQIIEDCYNKKKNFFQVSKGHFSVFYIRDFGWVIDSLIKLGYKDRVRNTLDYALQIYKKNKCVMTTINRNDRPFDFPYVSVDSLPYLLYSLSCLNDSVLINEYKSFLEIEIYKFYDMIVDKKNGLVRQDVIFSSMKDHSKRKSSCYDNCMLYLLSISCDKLKYSNPLEKWDYSKLIIDNFWNGDYFYDDMDKKDYVAGDANVFPFWVGLVNDEIKFKKVINSIQKNKLDYPFPLKYTDEIVQSKIIKLGLFANNYEGNSIWMHMGPLYIGLVGKVNKKLQKKYIEKYCEIIEFHSNFLEVFNPDGSVYKLPYYISDESMLWCANYLIMLKKVK